MKNWMVFHASTVDTSTVSVHDSGTDVDMCAFPADSLIAIAARNGAIEMTFKDTGKLYPGAVSNGGDDEVDVAIEATRVSIDVSNANIPTAIKSIIAVINQHPHGDGLLLFDEVNSVYPGALNSTICTAIAIERTTTNIAVATA